jgi:hypothetical protein
MGKERDRPFSVERALIGFTPLARDEENNRLFGEHYAGSDTYNLHFEIQQAKSPARNAAAGRAAFPLGRSATNARTESACARRSDTPTRFRGLPVAL